MAIAFDAASSGTVSGASSITVSHTVGAGSDRALVVSVVCPNSSNYLSGATVTYGGVDMGSARVSSTGAGALFAYTWVLANPATGTANIVVTPTSSAYMDVIASSWSGVDQTTPVDATATYSSGFAVSPVSTAITTTSGGVAVDMFAKRSVSGTTTKDASQTTITANVNDGVATAGGSYKASASAMQWTFSDTQPQAAHVIVALKEAAAGGNTISVPLATLTLTGYAPTVVATANNSIAVPLATLTLTGYSPTINNAANNNIDVPAGTLTLTAYAPTVSFTGDQTIAVPLATLTLTAYAPVVTNAITFITEPLINNTETILASVAVDWSWFPGGTIGTLNAITPTDGSGTTASDGTLTVTGISAGAGFVLITDGSGHVYYEAGTAA